MRSIGKVSTAGWGVLLVVGLAFATFGGLMGYKAIAAVLEWREMQVWTAVAAKIDRLDLEYHPGDGDGNGSRELVCTYSYYHGGQPYTNQRVGLYKEVHSIDSWHEDRHEEMKARQQRGETILCWVDPSNPSRAVLFRDLRPGVVVFHVLFLVFFGVGGMAMVVGGVRGKASAARRTHLQAQHPDEPWLYNARWASGVIPCGSRLNAIVAWCVALFWNAVSIPIAIGLVGHAASKPAETWKLLFLLFPLAGVGLLVGAVYVTLQHLKFGRSELRLATVPGAIGGQLAGEVVVRGAIRGIRTLDTTLRCVRKVTTGSGKHRRTEETELWQAKKSVETTTSFHGQELVAKFSFDIPDDCQPTDDSDSRRTIEWKLKTAAEVPGVNLGLEFDVPVFAVGDGRAERGRSRAFDPSEGDKVRSRASEAGEQSRGLGVQRIDG